MLGREAVGTPDPVARARGWGPHRPVLGLHLAGEVVWGSILKENTHQVGPTSQELSLQGFPPRRRPALTPSPCASLRPEEQGRARACMSSAVAGHLVTLSGPFWHVSEGWASPALTGTPWSSGHEAGRAWPCVRARCALGAGSQHPLFTSVLSLFLNYDFIAIS